MSLKDIFKQAKKDKVIKQELASAQWTASKIKILIQNNNIFVERGLCVLLARQTDTEVQMGGVNQNNNMGFTSSDANLLTSFAQQVINNPIGRIEGKRLSDRQFYWARKKLIKYAKQLAGYANNKDVAMVGAALGVNDPKDFEKGGTYRKVNFGDESTPAREDTSGD